MKKILSILMALVALSSCMSTPEGGEATPQTEDGALVKIRLRTPEGVTATRGLTDGQQNAIENIYALTFGADGRLREVVEGELSGDQGSFAVTLKSGTVDLTVLANSAAIIEGSGIAPGDTYTQVRTVLKEGAGSWKNDRTAGKPFPMWGEKAGFEIRDGATLDEPIKLTRAFARVDVGVGTYSQTTKSWNGKKSSGETIKFELSDISVMRANDSYALIPNGNGPTIPADVMQYSADQVCYNVGRDNTVQSVARLFLPEIAQGDNTPYGQRMALVIAGKYDGGPKSYYRVDFVVGGKVVDVLRNHLYRFTIKDVTGDGYADAIEAYNAQPMNIEVDVVAWEDGGESQVGFDGAYYFAIDTRTADLGVLKSSERVLNIHTNVPDFTLTSGSTTLKAGETKNTGMASYVLAGSGEDYTLKITTRADNIKSSGASATDTWAIAAKRIEMGFAAVQAGATEYITIDGEELTSKNAARVLFPEGGSAGVVEVRSATAMSVTGGQSWLTGATGTVSVPANTPTKLTLSAGVFEPGINATNTRAAKLAFGSTGKTYTITQHPFVLRPVETTLPATIPFEGGTYRVTAMTNYVDWGVKVVHGTDPAGTVLTTTAAPAASRPAAANLQAGVHSMDVTIKDVTTGTSINTRQRTVSLWLYRGSDTSDKWVKIGEWEQGIPEPQPTDISTGILYFAGDGTLNVGVWDNNLISLINAAFFKFGSVIGFENNTPSNSWPEDGSSIKFNPTMLQYGAGKDMTGYAPATFDATASTSLPYIPGYVAADYPMNVTVADGYVTPANIRLGKGDPCMLVGYSGEQLRAMTDAQLQTVLSNAKYRMATVDEWIEFVGGFPMLQGSGHWTDNSRNAWIPAVARFPVIDNAAGNQYQHILPALGFRGYLNGLGNSRGTAARYWTSTAKTATSGYRLMATSSTFEANAFRYSSEGYAIRCVRNMPEQNYLVVVNRVEGTNTSPIITKVGPAGTTFTLEERFSQYRNSDMFMGWAVEGGVTLSNTVELDYGRKTTATITGHGTVTATYLSSAINISSPANILWMDDDGRMQLGVYDPDYYAPPGATATEPTPQNVLFFKAGSVIGFDNRARMVYPETPEGMPEQMPYEDLSWPTDGSAIQFNPTKLQYGRHITGYAPAPYDAATSNALPYIPGYVAADYPKDIKISSGYVTVANLRAGKGDPCTLVGYTAEQLRGMTDAQLQAVLDNSKFHMATAAECYEFAGITERRMGVLSHWTDLTGGAVPLPSIAKYPVVDGGTWPKDSFKMPALGGRNNATGKATSVNTRVHYWVAEVSPDGNKPLQFYASYNDVNPVVGEVYSSGFNVRCLRNN
jgi:hypothetical protein